MAIVYGRTRPACRSLDLAREHRPTQRLTSEGAIDRCRGAVSPVVRIDARAYAGAADTLLYYMRQQRSGFNPFFKDSVHKRDGLVVDDSTLAGTFVPVSGGWADAGDYLQYVATSAHATYMMLMAYRDHPTAFDDEFNARGLVGRNGVPDVLDEARHGLEWLLRMFPNDSLLFNQLGDDRDHAFLDLPTTDSSDYGWGKGKERPVYQCTGRQQGLSTRTARLGKGRRQGSTHRRLRSGRKSSRGAIRPLRRSYVGRHARHFASVSDTRVCVRPPRGERPTSTRKTTGTTTWSSRRRSAVT